MLQCLYVFIDESGDFNFSLNGSKHYVFTALLTCDPFKFVDDINKLHIDLLTGRLLPKLDPDYLEDHLSKNFHASEDRQPVRDLFFDQISKMDNIYVNSIVVRKNRTNKVLRDPHTFYPKFLGSLLAYIFKVYQFSELCIFIAGTPVTARKKQFIKTIKNEIVRRNPRINYHIYFPSTSSQTYLQIVDYINWAIYKKWEENDFRSYDLIKKHLQSTERDIFRYGDMDYY